MRRILVIASLLTWFLGAGCKKGDRKSEDREEPSEGKELCSGSSVEIADLATSLEAELKGSDGYKEWQEQLPESFQALLLDASLRVRLGESVSAYVNLYPEILLAEAHLATTIHDPGQREKVEKLFGEWRGYYGESAKAIGSHIQCLNKRGFGNCGQPMLPGYVPGGLLGEAAIQITKQTGDVQREVDAMIDEDPDKWEGATLDYEKVFEEYNAKRSSAEPIALALAYAELLSGSIIGRGELVASVERAIPVMKAAGVSKGQLARLETAANGVRANCPEAE